MKWTDISFILIKTVLLLIVYISSGHCFILISFSLERSYVRIRRATVNYFARMLQFQVIKGNVLFMVSLTFSVAQESPGIGDLEWMGTVE